MDPVVEWFTFWFSQLSIILMVVFIGAIDILITVLVSVIMLGLGLGQRKYKYREVSSLLMSIKYWVSQKIGTML